MLSATLSNVWSVKLAAEVEPVVEVELQLEAVEAEKELQLEAVEAEKELQLEVVESEQVKPRQPLLQVHAAETLRSLNP